VASEGAQCEGATLQIQGSPGPANLARKTSRRCRVDVKPARSTIYKLLSNHNIIPIAELA